MSKQITTKPPIENLIHDIRGQRVILDSDLAVLYGVTKKRLLEQFRRNRDRFPDDFAFILTKEESTFLMPQIAASSFMKEAASNLILLKRTVAVEPHTWYLPNTARSWQQPSLIAMKRLR